MKTYKIHFGIYLGFFFFVCTSLLFAQQTTIPRPKKIGGIAKEEKPISYYQEQSKLWQALLDKDLDNAEAWNHYYKAERAKLQLEQPELWSNDKSLFYEKLSPIITRAQKHIGDKFEYHYIKGINSSGESALDALEKAYSIDPDRSEVYGWLFSKYIPRFNEKECKDLAKRMLHSNIYSDANLKWNYNALQSVEENGIIISNGDMDGIPKWVLQYGAEVRQDVLVVNKWLLAYELLYRKNIYSKLNLSPPISGISDFGSTAIYADYLAADILKRSLRPAYISSGTPLQFFKNNGLEDKMYLVGNALKYSDKSFNNTIVIEKNFEQKYYLEYLFKNFQQHPEDEIVRSQMNITYLPALVHLINHYKLTNQIARYEYYNGLINKIADDSGRKDEVLNWFNR